jgi:hypothetical protein
MPATTVDAATDAERKPDAATTAEKSAVTLNYEAMLAALNDLLAEIREERRQAEGVRTPTAPTEERPSN